MKSIYDAVKDALVERGWRIDETATETRSRELHEFIDPETGRRMAWLDAIDRQQELEIKQERGRRTHGRRSTGRKRRTGRKR